MNLTINNNYLSMENSNLETTTSMCTLKKIGFNENSFNDNIKMNQQYLTDVLQYPLQPRTDTG